MNIEHERTMHTIKNHMYEAKRERNLKPKSPQLATKEEDGMKNRQKGRKIVGLLNGSLYIYILYSYVKNFRERKSTRAAAAAV